MTLSKSCTYLLISAFLLLASACNQKEKLCELPGANEALKTALKLKMAKWQSNAEYAGMENFESEINEVIDQLTIVENSFHRGGDESCHCKAKVRFLDHEAFLETIAGPVAKVKAEEHPMNSKYLRMEDQINYLEDDGFEFFYVMNMSADSILVALERYPLALQTQIDDASNLLFEYLEYRLSNSPKPD